MREFVREALASDIAIEEGAAVYRARDVHSWLERLAKNRKATQPKKTDQTTVSANTRSRGS